MNVNWVGQSGDVRQMFCQLDMGKGRGLSRKESEAIWPAWAIGGGMRPVSEEEWQLFLECEVESEMRRKRGGLLVKELTRDQVEMDEVWEKAKRKREARRERERAAEKAETRRLEEVFERRKREEAAKAMEAAVREARLRFEAEEKRKNSEWEKKNREWEKELALERKRREAEDRAVVERGAEAEVEFLQKVWCAEVSKLPFVWGFGAMYAKVGRTEDARKFLDALRVHHAPLLSAMAQYSGMNWVEWVRAEPEKRYLVDMSRGDNEVWWTGAYYALQWATFERLSEEMREGAVILVMRA
jgi:hypothetical protein